MASLRETKKLATRRAISESVARILLRDGQEGLTISQIAKEAEVSVRTFHNYFSSIEEAQFQFCLDTIEEFLPVIETYSKELTITEVFEDIAIQGLVREGSEFRSIATLFQIQEHTLSRCGSLAHLEEIEVVLESFQEAFAQQYPDMDDFEVGLSLRIGAATIVWAAEQLAWQQIESREEREAFIRRAFTTIRAIK